MTYYSDMILKIVKISVLLLILGLAGSVGLPLGWIDAPLESAIHSVVSYTALTGIAALILYLFGSYHESKKLITCTGCKVVNYVGNFILYLLIMGILYTLNALIY